MNAYKPHFMIIPSLSCPAQCTYCFGPRQGSVMSLQDMTGAIEFIKAIAEETGLAKVKITFHGGEPLMAGHDVIRLALHGLSTNFGSANADFALQSNLWLLDDAFCEMFETYNVEIGTSLDGPETITDAQRGSGYFSRTMHGISLARTYNLKVSCIATFTPDGLEHRQEVLDFFREQRLGLAIHAAVPSLDGNSSRQALTPQQYERLLPELLEYYLLHRREIAITSLDQACKGVFLGTGQVCTFRDCLGDFLVIDPKGDIYPCQRLAGLEEFRLGNITGKPGVDELFDSPAARRMRQRERQVHGECGDCRHFNYCKGGCAYNAWAANGPDKSDSAKDPYCRAYDRFFDNIGQRLHREMAAEENIAAIAHEPDSGSGHFLLRKGELIELVQEGPHPSRMVRSARRVIAAVELADGPDIPTAAARLVKMGVARNRQSGEASLLNLKHSISPGSAGLNRLYIHVTFRCQLNCTHCYAHAGTQGNRVPDMPVKDLIELVHQARELGFAQVTITGGEPLLHECRDRLLEALHQARQKASPMILSLRTNLALPLSSDDLKRIGAAAHHIVVSLDGDEPGHDARRGHGSFALTAKNLELYVKLAEESGDMGELSLAGVMSLKESQDRLGDAVRRLARDLGIKRTRFKPLLPIGRALELRQVLEPESPVAFAYPMEIIARDFQPVYTCGLGQNLYVESTGQAFPCYAYHKPHAFLGNVISEGLDTIVSGKAFRELSRHTVDTNPKCRLCRVRYLCGGACRAWGGEEAQYEPDAPPGDCYNLQKRAEELYTTACDYLGITTPFYAVGDQRGLFS